MWGFTAAQSRPGVAFIDELISRQFCFRVVGCCFLEQVDWAFETHCTDLSAKFLDGTLKPSGQSLPKEWLA